MQRFLIITALFFLLPINLHADPQSPKDSMPLSLPWDKKLPETFREIPGFKYWYGDMEWGMMIFTGEFQRLEAEVHLSFARNRIVNASLILGPSGINVLGCRKTFHNIVKLLNTKYGEWKKSKSIESELKEDLFYTSFCTPVRAGLHVEEIRWKTDLFFIVASLFGDGEDIFIEIDYHYRPLRGVKKTPKILEKL